MILKTILNPARFFFLVTVLVLNACATISSFDHYAYVQSTSLKVEALALMDLAIDDYPVHEKEIKELQLQLEKAYEYEKHRAKNTITVNLWDKLKDPNGNLLGGFFLLWKEEGRAGKVYISEKKKQVGQAFDIISELESRKIKPSQITSGIFN